jgi:hypothetical protein
MKAAASSIAFSILLCACAGPAPRIEAQSPAVAASAAVAEQVRRCYRRPRVPSAGRNIVTRLFARYTADGQLVGLPLLVSQQGLNPETAPYASRMAEAAKLAVVRCSPVRLPPESGRKLGSDFLLTFSTRLSA